jgi:hypothetical protein
VLSREATNTNFIVFGLTQAGLEHTIYRTRGGHAYHYTTDAVSWVLMLFSMYVCFRFITPAVLNCQSNSIISLIALPPFF